MNQASAAIVKEAEVARGAIRLARKADRYFSERVHPNHPCRPALFRAVEKTFEERLFIGMQEKRVPSEESIETSAINGKKFLSVMELYQNVSIMINDRQFQHWIGAPKSISNLEAFLTGIEAEEMRQTEKESQANIYISSAFDALRRSSL